MASVENRQINKAIPDALKEVLNDTFAQKNSVEVVGGNLKNLADVLKESVPEISKLNKINDDMLLLALDKDSTSGVRDAKGLAACYANCYNNCHNACHGSRGWR
jgi:hypothetical protein